MSTAVVRAERASQRTSEGRAQRAKDAVPYTPGVTFWSDGAEKQRYLYLPPGAKIVSQPENTKLDGPFGWVTIDVEKQGDRVTVTPLP